MRKPILILIILLLINGLYFYQKNKTKTRQGVKPSLVKQIALEITDPKNNSTVNNPEITVVGKTVAGASIFVNNKELTADSAGKFSTPLTLDEGENIIVVVANDELGNYSEKEINVTLATLE